MAEGRLHGRPIADDAFDATEIGRATLTIHANMACCVAWAAINGVAAWSLHQPRLLGVAIAALAMVGCWVVALRDLARKRVIRGVLNYVISGLVLLLAMGLCVPEMSVLFVFATFIFLAYGLSYADRVATSAVVGLTMVVAAALLFTSFVLRATSGVPPELLRWANVIGLTMALTINAVSFVALRRTLEERGRRLSDEAKFRALTASASDAIVTANAQGAITYVNGAAETMFGRTAEEALGRPLGILMPERLREAHRRGLERLLATGEARLVGRRAVEVVGLRCDGTEFPIELSLAMWHAGDAPSFSAILRDVTERRRIENDLRLAKERAESASHELEAFSYSVAHDLRAPLRAMSGYSAALVDEIGPALKGDTAQYLQRIQDGAVRMGYLIDALLGLSRMSRTEVRRVRVSLSELTESIAEQLQASEPQRRVELDIAGGLVDELDPQLARVLLENLLGNAWKFTARTAAARVAFGREASGAYFVRDNGAGFDMEYAAKLFAPFQRLHSVEEFPGTGIGLATVQRVVARHGGRIWAESRPGHGATFRFTLAPDPGGAREGRRQAP